MRELRCIVANASPSVTWYQPPQAFGGDREAMNSGTDNGMVLRTGTVDDAAAAAALHAGQISEGFLSILGPDFLRRLYRRIARTPDSFLLIVEDGTGAWVFWLAPPM